jgi:hypothetical protein
MVTIVMLSSSLLRSFIILTGIFGKTLMKQWQSCIDSNGLFTSNHWMTLDANLLSLQNITDLYKDRRVRGWFGARS